MTQSKTRLTAMTAIAAVLALASPAMAQDAVPTPVTTPDPLGAAPSTVEPVPSTDPAPTATTADPLSATTAVGTSPAPATTTRARTTPRRATTTAAGPARPVTRPAPSAPAVASSTSASPARVEALAPDTAPIVAAAPPVAALPAPVEAPQAAPAEIASNDVVPLAAAGGLGLLALLGAGVALRRRKRRDEDVEYAELDEPMFDAPKVPVAFAEPMREPSMKREPLAAAASAPIDAPAQALPEGFDLSRFGAHVQAAYRGPTEDNPSLSLKNRLRRASAMDQMARTSDAPAAPPASRALAAATAARDTGAVVSKMRPAPSASGSFILGGDAKRPALTPVTQH